MTLASRQYGREPLPYSPRLVNVCMNHSWSGNLRELECFVRRYLILGDEDFVVAELCEGAQPSPAPVELSLRPFEGADHDLKGVLRNMKRQVEREAIVNALAKLGGNRSKTARLLNISYRALLYKIREFGIDLPNSENARVGMKCPGKY
jgi:two-component system response regulator AtoC